MIWQTIQVPEMTSSRSYNRSAALKEQVKTLWKLARNGMILSAKTMQTRTALPTGTRRHLPATPALWLHLAISQESFGNCTTLPVYIPQIASSMAFSTRSLLS